ncbi:toll-like receptor 4 [Mytilus californianus]|uniref:toll-like receptor 4 n=1 Tax=Mytilus californianus TaxID=6549 RepID=UPI002247A9E8|nr:toll-like receptor 4 [Mytilus californianus]
MDKLLLIWMVNILYFNFIVGQNSQQCTTEKRCQCKEVESGLLADCSGLNLNSYPKFFDGIVTIDVSYNKLNDFPSTLDFPTTLKHLNLSGNLLERVDTVKSRKLFSYINNLASPNLSSNFIPLDPQAYPEDIFMKLTKLKSLDLTRNTLTQFEFRNLDHVIKPLVSLESFAIDGSEKISFGVGFCNEYRLLTIKEDYFDNLSNLKTLDISSEIDRNFTAMNWTTSLCSLFYIYRGAISKLSHLRFLDISYNRELGLCGFSNITQDLPFTQIRILRANYLHCNAGPSVTLLCEDIKPFTNTSLEELYFDGNNIDFAQTGVLYYLPASLKRLTLKNNRWIQNRYTYCNTFGLTNLTYLDISDMNQHQISSDEQYVDCLNFIRILNCEKLRSSSFGTSLNPRVPELCIKECLLPGRQENFYAQKKLDNVNNGKTNISYRLRCSTPKPYAANVKVIFVPRNIEHIVMNNSRLGHTLKYTYFASSNLKSLVLSHNQFYSLIGPICNATKLKYLDLSNNRCSHLSAYVFSELIAVEKIVLDNNLIGSAQILKDKNIRNLFSMQSKLKELSLTSNRIKFLPREIFWNLKNLRYLNLSKNQLTDWNVNIEQMRHLIYLDLSENQILFLSDTGMALIDSSFSKTFTVDLSSNPIQCNYDSHIFIMWLIKRQEIFKNFEHYNCQLIETNITDIPTANAYLKKKCSSYVSLIVLSINLIICFLALLVIAIVYRHRWKLRYWYYIAKRQYVRGYNGVADEKSYRFDAFISYADEDRLFVTKSVKTKLEEEGNLRLCIHHRDFIPGCDIADNIINAIHQSRKVIFIITEAFLKSEWCMYEVHMAHTENVMSRQGTNMLILVFKEKIPQKRTPQKIMQIVQEEVYIDFPDDIEGEEIFWNHLTDSLL